MNPLKPQSTRESAIVVIFFLGLHSMVSLVGVIFLCYAKAEPALIAFVAGQGGVSIGALGSMLNQTEKQMPATTIQSAEQVNSGGPTNLTPPADQA